MPEVRRRELIALLGGAAAAAWPVAVRAQQSAMPVVGFLRSSSIKRSPHLVAAFLQGLKEAGYLEGQNVTIAYRSAEGQYDRLATLAADLVQRRVNIIVATGGSAPAQVAKAATSAIPIVFTTASDPVRDGLVASLNQPGGNLTGISLLATDIGSKRLGLLRELVPNATTIALLQNPKNPDLGQHAQEVQTSARNLGHHIRVLNAANEDDIDSAFAAMARERPDALLLDPDPFLVSRREQIVIPALYDFRESVEAGGLASYGPSHTEPYRLAGIYAGRILKGAKPTDLPVVQSTKFELAINLRTAKRIGFEIPPTLLARADEVIE
jgi:putative tryptophan/tyrosine transport system substrate-binding protein